MASADEPDELYDERKQLLTTAVIDVKGSIHANDQKVAAALVVNGLLFTGVVTVLTHTEGVYSAAQAWQRSVGALLLALTTVLFVASVGYLLWAMKPYRPTEIEKKMTGCYPRVFFPRPDDITSEVADGTHPWRKPVYVADPFHPWRERVSSLQRATILDELTAELLKLADILHTESRRASKGYGWLRLEGLSALILLGFVAAVAATQVSLPL